MLPINTERLLLRRFSPEDAGDIQKFAADPLIARHLNGFPGKTIEEIHSYINQQGCYEPGDIGKCFDLAVHLRLEEMVIGLVTLVTHEYQQGEVGFALNAAYQRQGYATEAVSAVITYGFEVLHLHRVFAKTERQNISSWMLLERLGMRREGLLLQDHRVDGEWKDTYIYAMLNHDWSKRNRTI